MVFLIFFKTFLSIKIVFFFLSVLSNDPFIIQNGDRIAQLVIAQHEQGEWIEVEQLEATTRGNKGFGSTGVK